MASGRAHLSLPAALRFLLQPAGLHGPGAELDTADVAARVARGRALGAVQLGFSGGEPLLRDDLEDPDRRGARLGLLLEPDHLGRRSQRRAHRRVQGRRTRPHPVVVPGLDARVERFPVEHAHLRTQVERSPGSSRRTIIRWCSTVVLHRLNVDHVGADPRDGGGDGRRVCGARQYAVLRLGHTEPRAAAAHARAAGARGGGHRALPRRESAPGCGSSSWCRIISRRGRSAA